jgi:hypothetical protein
VCVCVCVCVETWSYSVAQIGLQFTSLLQASLKFAMYLRLALNLQSSCLCLLSAGIIGMHTLMPGWGFQIADCCRWLGWSGESLQYNYVLSSNHGIKRNQDFKTSIFTLIDNISNSMVSICLNLIICLKWSNGWSDQFWKHTLYKIYP